MRFRPHLPEKIKEVVKKIQDSKDLTVADKQIPLDYSEENFNKKDYFENPNVRIIDPLFLIAFYGMYESKEIPPYPLKEYTLPDGVQHDFGSVDVTSQKKIMNHLIFCLWVKQNGLPEERKNSFEYRKGLYIFLDNVLEDEYFMSVTIPFYLEKALKSPRKFVDRLGDSNYVKFEDSFKSPEYIAVEFEKVQQKFYEYIFADAKDDSLKVSATTSAIVKGGESGSAEFKSTAFWSTFLSSEEIARRVKEDPKNNRDLIEYGKDTSKIEVAKSIAGFLNSNGGSLLIGVKENKEKNIEEIIGLEVELKKFRENERSLDAYQRRVIDSIIRKYFYPEFFNHIDDFITFKFPVLEGKTVCQINIHKSEEPVFLNYKNKFFIRTATETRELTDPKQIHEYCSERFKK